MEGTCLMFTTLLIVASTAMLIGTLVYLGVSEHRLIGELTAARRDVLAAKAELARALELSTRDWETIANMTASIEALASELEVQTVLAKSNDAYVSLDLDQL